MVSVILQLIIGISILLIATHYLIKFAKKLSFAYKLSPLIVGITVVAIGTSLPELSVSTIAVLKDDAGLAFGNIIGSNIINVFLIFGLGLIISKIRIGTIKTQRNALVLLGSTILFIIFFTKPIPTIFSGIILLSLAFLITVQEYRWAIRGRKNEDKLLLNKNSESKFSSMELVSLPFLVVGIIAGGFMVVTSVETISRITGYSTTVLGLNVTAIATSFPELLATIAGRNESKGKLVVGNIVGSNIYNILLIGGIMFLFSGITQLVLHEILWLLFATFLFVSLIKLYKGKTVPKWIGVLLLFLFIIYIYSL
jgi:cation:H+ antiporter